MVICLRLFSFDELTERGSGGTKLLEVTLGLRGPHEINVWSGSLAMTSISLLGLQHSVRARSTEREIRVNPPLDVPIWSPETPATLRIHLASISG